MTDMDRVPLSEQHTIGAEISKQDLDQMWADLAYLGKVSKLTDDNDAGGDPKAVPLGEFLDQYIQNVRLELKATNDIRVAYSSDRIPRLVIDGYMVAAEANVDWGTPIVGAPRTLYVFAQRNAVTTTFTLQVDNAPAPGVDQRAIGSFFFDGTNIDEDSIVSYETDLGADVFFTPKLLLTFTSAGVILAERNVSALVKTGTGQYTVTIDNDFLNLNYILTLAAVSNDGGTTVDNLALGSFDLHARNSAGSYSDKQIGVAAWGDQ